MKDNISKILGVVLTLALVVSVAGVAAPADNAVAAPADNVWELSTAPRDGTNGSWVIADSGGAGAAGPIARAIDGTLYCYANPTVSATTSRLFKSTDGGHKWTPVGLVTVALIDIAVSPTDANVLYITDGTNIWKSADAGASFTALGALAGGNISSIDCAEWTTGKYIVVAGVLAAGTQDVYTYDETETFPVWTSQGLATYIAATYTTFTSALDVALSPDFATGPDRQIVAVASGDFDGDATVDDTLVTTKIGGAGWGATVGDAVIANVLSTNADIAFPSDYDSDTTVGTYVQFVALATGAAGGDLYQILGVAAPGVSAAVDRNCGGAATNTDLYSVAVAGSGASAKVLVGELSNAIVRYSTNSGSTWETLYKQPTGVVANEMVDVVMDGDFATSGEAWAAVKGNEGGVSHTANFATSWNQTGLIDTTMTAVNDLSVAGGTVFIASQDATPDDSIWRYDGTNWERIYSSTAFGPADMVEVSPSYATDNTVFVTNAGGTGIFRSNTGGEIFAPQTTAVPAAIRGWVVIDTNNLITGGAANVYVTSNNGLSWTTRAVAGAGNIVSLVASPDYATDGTLLAGDNGGLVFVSTTNGASWSQLLAAGTIPGGNTFVAFSNDFATDNIVYATSVAGAGVFRYVVGTSTAWTRIDNVNLANPAGGTVATGAGLVVSPDGTLYATDSSAAAQGVSRSLDPTLSVLVAARAPFFEPAANTATGTVPALAGLWLTEGSNVLWSISGANVYKYTDVLAVSPSLTSPANGAASGRQTSAAVSFEALGPATSYDVNYDIDPSFAVGAQTLTPALNSAIIAGYPIGTPLASGATYYWRVRVTAGSPVRSRWSDTWSFTTAMGAAQWNPFAIPGNVAPTPGATGVPVRPSFQWNAADWATGYEFELADNSAFDSPMVSTTTTATAFAYDSDLDFSTTYYWRVRAVSDASSSEWATGIFTTEAAPAEEPEPTPAPTPAWVWAIIAIGALLLVAMLVLIMRTRRAA